MNRTLALGFDPAGRSWVAEGSKKPMVGLPPLDGALRIDEPALEAVARDFGNLRHLRPIAVLEPGSDADVVRMVLFAREHRLKIGPRGSGHTSYGQSQVEGGIVVRISALNRKPIFAKNHAVVSAGMQWRELLLASLPVGLRPPVMTQTDYLSVGGTLSVGGMDGGSYRYGVQVDNALELDVVTGEGQLETCSETQLPELFNSVLAGLGQCGIILRAKLRMIPAQTHTLFVQVLYRDLQTMLADQRQLINDGRFDRISAHIAPSASGGWMYFMNGGCNFTPPDLPDKDQLLRGLNHLRGFERISPLTYFEYIERTRQDNDSFIHGSRANLPHPWFNMYLPGSKIEEYAQEIFDELLANGTAPDFRTELYGFHKELCRRPLFRLPDEPVSFLFNLLGTITDPEAAHKTVARNRRYFEKARALGGKRYPMNAVPMDPEDWPEHYHPNWEAFVSAKHCFDPDNILTPGPGIFTSIQPAAI